MKLVYTLNGITYTPSVLGTLTLIKAAKNSQLKDGDRRKDEKGQEWVFNGQTRRWRKYKSEDKPSQQQTVIPVIPEIPVEAPQAIPEPATLKPKRKSRAKAKPAVETVQPIVDVATPVEQPAIETPTPGKAKRRTKKQVTETNEPVSTPRVAATEPPLGFNADYEAVKGRKTRQKRNEQVKSILEKKQEGL